MRSSVVCCFFGLFDPDDEKMYVEDLAVDLLVDEFVNIAALPDALERQLARPLGALRSAGVGCDDGCVAHDTY